MFDLLYRETESAVSADAMDDVLFSELQNKVFGGKIGLYSSFVKVVSSPLTDRSAILKRQEIFRDFLKSPHLIDSMCEICKKAKDVQPESRKSLYQKIDAQKRLQINYQAIHRIFAYIDTFGTLMQSCRFHSSALNNVKEYFEKTDRFSCLFNGLSELTQRAQNMCFYSAEIEFNKLAAFKSMMLKSYDLSVIDSEEGSKIKTKLFRIKKSKCDDSLKIDYSDNKDVERQVEEITEKFTYDICKVLAAVYTYFKAIFSSLYEQLMFYQAALIYLNYLQHNGQGCCFPDFVSESNYIETSKLYLFPIISHSDRIDTNDFCTEADNVFVITGYNRAGKTTFLRSIGFAQISAQAGLMVPACSYRCSVFQYIMTHFPKGEEKQLSAGLFEDELNRLKSSVACIKNYSLVLLNESFSTTVEAEAEKHASNIISALVKIGSMVFFVTHFYKFAMHIDDLNERFEGKATVANLITKKYEKPNERTNYQIVRGNPIPNYKIQIEEFV